MALMTSRQEPSAASASHPTRVIPAQAGIQMYQELGWIPAFAGMTKVEFRRNLQQTQNARRRRLLRFTARRFRRREDGAVLVEFAIILPILAVLFLGLAEFTEAFSVNRKLAGAAGAVADLVAQEASVDNSYLADTDSLAQELMKPHNTAPFQLVIVSIIADADNTTTVDWSYPSGAYAKGAGYALPDGAMTSPNSSMIVAEARYNFTPTVGQFLGTFEMSETAHFRPRLAQKVMKTN